MPSPGAAQFWMANPPPVEPLRFRRAPLLAAAIAFAAGTRLPHQFPSFILLALALLLALTLLALHKSPRLAPIPTLALWAVAGCWCAQIQPSPSLQTGLRPYADNLSRTVRGQVVRIRTLPALPTARRAGELPQPWLSAPTTDPAETPAEAVSLDLAIDHVEYLTPDIDELRPVTGGVRLTLLNGTPALHCGDELELPLRLHTPDLYRDAGAWSYTDELLAEGITTQSTVKATSIQILPATTRSEPWTLNPGPSLHCRAFAAQTWAAHRLTAFVTSPANRTLPRTFRLTADDAAMLSAMLFGDRAGLRRDLRLGFERTGSFHLFVVSGMHVALLAGMFFWTLRRLRTPRSAATILTIAATTAYATLTGFGLPVERALLMTTVFLLARWLGRDVSILQALGAAALAVLAFEPRALTEASFQMTFLVLIAVGGLALPIAHRLIHPRLHAARNLDALWLDPQLPPYLAQQRVLLRLFGTTLAALMPPVLPRLLGPGPWTLGPRSFTLNPRSLLRHLPAFTLRSLLRLSELLLISLVIEAAMALPMAIYFHRATPFALPANILAIPLVAILAPLAILTFCAALLSPTLALIPAALTALTLHAVSYAITHLSHLRFADTRIPSPTSLAIAAAITAIAYSTWSLRQRSRTLALTGALAVALIPIATLWPTPPALHPNTLEITALDVGQGDSLLVVSPDGHTLLVDAGGPVGQPASAALRWDVGEEVVAPYLWSRRIRTLDAVLLTHAHSDHMGGLPAILRDFHPRELWLSIDPGNSPDFRSLLALAAQLNIPIRHFQAGDTFPFGGLTATALSPEPTYTNPASPLNDDSLVLRLDYNRASALLEGDAERPSESRMIANHRITPVTLLKIGHHGSLTSTNPTFLAAASPHEAIISDGRRNTFGHPRPEILERLEAAHIPTYRTDRQGATTFLLTPDGHITAQSAGP